MSFDHLEKQLIRPTFQEPRVHFALNCASRSCPPLASRPFDASTLEQDLDTLTRAFVNDHPQGVTFQNSTLRLSRVFDWYRDDFASAGGIIAFLNRHRTQLLPPNTKLNYFEYDWSLNSAP
jgi:hypothetical protein